MKISLSTFVYFRYSLVEAINRIGLLGYDAVELWGGRPHAYAPDMDATHINEIKTVIQDHNLTLSNFIPAQFRYPVNIAIADETIRQGSLDYLKASIDAAAALNAPYVSLCPGFSIIPQTKTQAWETLLKSLSELIDYVRGMPLDLLLEPAHVMESDLVANMDDGLRLVEALNNGIGLLPDTGHLFISGDSLVEAIEKTKNMPCHWHMDDNFGKTDDHLIPGEGKIDYAPFIQALINSGYKGSLAVELGYAYILNPDDAVKKSLTNIKQIIEEAVK